MKFLCLAYGDEAGWNSLSEGEQQEVLSNDKAIKDRGDLMSAVQPKVTTVKNWDKQLEITDESTAKHGLPLAGFSVIEADSIGQVIELVKNLRALEQKGLSRFGSFGMPTAMGIGSLGQYVS